MSYYKLISGETFVGVSTQLDFRKYQEKHNILLACDSNAAQYIQSGELLYHDNWMAPISTDKYSYESVDVIEIDETEYNTLYSAIESGEEISVEDTSDEQTVEDVYVDPSDTVTLDYVMNAKVTEMNNTCNNVISNGFDITLSDDELHHFSLTIQDQLNLITLSTMVASGETEIPYHADDEACKYYSVEDITAIISMATYFKTYHVSYFNALKLYIQSLDDIETISEIYYGMEIPEEYQTEVLKSIVGES